MYFPNSSYLCAMDCGGELVSFRSMSTYGTNKKGGCLFISLLAKAIRESVVFCQATLIQGPHFKLGDVLVIWLDLLFLEDIHYDEGMENVNWVSLGALVFSSRHRGCPYCLGAVYKGVPFPLLAGIGPSIFAF